MKPFFNQTWITVQTSKGNGFEIYTHMANARSWNFNDKPPACVASSKWKLSLIYQVPVFRREGGKERRKLAYEEMPELWGYRFQRPEAHELVEGASDHRLYDRCWDREYRTCAVRRTPAIRCSPMRHAKFERKPWRVPICEHWLKTLSLVGLPIGGSKGVLL